MARALNGTTQYMTNASAAVSGYPATLACWFYSATAGGDRYIMSVGVEGDTANMLGLIGAGDSAGDPIRAQSVSGSDSAVATTSTGFTVNTWHHACGVFAAANDRRAFIDGGSKGTDANSITPTGMNVTKVGARPNNANLVSGRIAEAAVWNAALTDDEVASLGKGISPLRIRPASLVRYWPLYGASSPEPEYINREELTLVNSPTQADHPRIYRIKPHVVGQAAAVTGTPYYYRRRMAA